MIFKKLTLKNFMSYSDAKIDFSGIHTACLSGPNGAGKSTLLDAISWTIWEEGRARTDELIKLGTNEMACEVEFFMEDELYRVYRSRTKGLKNSQGKSNLEFQIFNPKEKTWASLSKSAVRQTQELVIKTLKMDHESFTNSVYLKQGKADEFTTKKPGERKKILSDILGLQVYDELSVLASLNVKNIERDISIEESMILELRNKIEKEDELKKTLLDYSGIVKDEEQKLKETKDKLRDKEEDLSKKKEKESQLKTLERSKENQNSLIKVLESQLKSIQDKENKNSELLKNKGKIISDHTVYISLKNEFLKKEKEKEQYGKLLQEKSKLELDLKDKLNETEQNLAIYKSKIAERENSKATLLEKLKSESKFIREILPVVEKEIKEFYTLQQAVLEIEAQGQELKHEKAFIDSEVNNITNKQKDIKGKITTLSYHSHSEPCPLCKGKIKDKTEVIKSYEEELAKETKHKENKLEEIKLLDEKMQLKREKYSELKKKINGFSKDAAFKQLKLLEGIRQENYDYGAIEKTEPSKVVTFLESQLEISKSEFQKIKETVLVLDNEVTSYKDEVESIEKVKSDGTLIKECSVRLSQIQKELSFIDYDDKKYNEMKKSLSENEKIVFLYDSLMRAEEETQALSKESNSLALKIKEGYKESDELETLIKDSKLSIGNIDSLEKEVNELRKKENEDSILLHEARTKLIVTEEVIKEIENAKKLIKEKESKISKAVNDKKYYEILEKAFSKNGIQIAVIETVVPELEKEANRILSKLADNQMHVALRTQRERKSAEGLVETLDIIIADNAGTRSYELYSGGEAFKIDFALRLALSTLLANRAGAKLQTLIIDEGFGSQDSDGRERLIEVIRSIESEFELILVVTHLDELKESFPAQLQVYKDEEGSHVSLVM